MIRSNNRPEVRLMRKISRMANLARQSLLLAGLNMEGLSNSHPMTRVSESLYSSWCTSRPALLNTVLPLILAAWTISRSLPRLTRLSTYRKWADLLLGGAWPSVIL